MIIEETFTVEASPADVADFLMDVDRAKDCVPGVSEIRRTGEDSYEATLHISLGAIRPSFMGSIEVDRSGSPGHLSAKAKGRDRSTGSVATVAFEAQLTEQEHDVTRVSVTSDVTIRGKLGQFGTGVIRSTAQEVVREFASCVNVRLADPAIAAPAQPSVGRTIGRGFLAYLRSLLDRLVEKLRGKDRVDSRRARGE